MGNTMIDSERHVRGRVPETVQRATNALLFFVPTAIWGTTWLVIKFQLGTVAPEVSVAWRFALASLLLLGGCGLRRVSLRFGLAEHAALVALGVVLFGVNYVLVYRAETILTSGLVAVLFAFIVFWNLAGERLFFRTRIPGAVIVAAGVGVLGVTLLFWPEVTGIRGDPRALAGVAFALSGSLASSAGNLLSQRIFSERIAVMPGTAYAMGYSAVALLGWCLLRGVPVAFDPRPAYLLSLVYLAVFGSIGAFVTYLTLVQRAGSGRAGYTAAVIPVVAMLASTIFEGYRWSLTATLGMAMVLAGNVVVLRTRARR